jgi:DNA-binding transcriptional LysR family regulator
VLASVQHARDTVAATVGTLQGTVSIGLSIALPPDVDAPWLISEFRAAHPAVQVRLVHDASHRLFDRVRSGELDFAVAATTGAPPAGLTTLDLGTSPMVFACGPDHRLGRSEAVTLDTVAGETFVDFQRDWTIRRLVDIAFEAAGIARNSAYIVNEATYLLRFVERGLAVAILPEVFGQLHADVRYIPFHPGLPPWHAVGAHLGDEPAGAAARAMLKFSCDHVRAVRSVEHD